VKVFAKSFRKITRSTIIARKTVNEALSHGTYASTNCY